MGVYRQWMPQKSKIMSVTFITKMKKQLSRLIYTTESVLLEIMTRISFKKTQNTGMVRTREVNGILEAGQRG